MTPSTNTYEGIDVTVVEDFEEDEPTDLHFMSVGAPRKRTTTAMQSPIEIELLCQICREQ